MPPSDKPKVLGSDAFLDSDAPYWENEAPIFWDRDQLPLGFRSHRLDEFPLIEDFEVRLEDTEYAAFGYHIHFFSRSRGYIASFPWWDHAEADLIKPTFQIPIGDFQHAFSDLEQSWIIYIAAQGKWVFVVEGHLEDYVEKGFYTWFKVDKDFYLAAWKKTIDLCKAKFLSK